MGPLEQKLGIILIVDAKIFWVNDKFTELTGFTMDELLSNNNRTTPKNEIALNLLARINSIRFCNNTFSELFEEKNCSHQVLNYWFINQYIIRETNQKLITIFPCSENELTKTSQKYASSNLTKDLKNSLYEKLKLLFKEEKLYKNKDCNLALVANNLQTNTKYLSQVVNSVTGLNFCEFINRYRVNHFKQLVSSGIHLKLSLEGISQECGFSNKVSFYKAVKKFTDATPKELIKSIYS